MPLERDVVKVQHIVERGVTREEQTSQFASFRQLKDFEDRIKKGQKLSGDETSQYQRMLEVRKEKKARFTQVLERGVVAERLSVALPSDKYGEWVAADAQEIARMEQLGFWIDKDYAKNRRLHSDGSDVALIGDALFMVCERETYELLEEVRIERKNAMHGKTGEKGKEERDFSTKIQTQAPELPVVDDSKARGVSKEELAATLGYRELNLTTLTTGGTKWVSELT